MKLLLKHIRTYNAAPLMLAVLLCSFTNWLLLKNSDSVLFLFFPGLSWGLALVLPVVRFVKDRRYSLVAFTCASLMLWMMMIPIGGLLGALLLMIHPLSGFALLGAAGAFCSYFLYAKFVLDRFSVKEACTCSVLGAVAFLLSSLAGPGEKHLIGQPESSVLYWQLLAGAGHVAAYARCMSVAGTER